LDHTVSLGIQSRLHCMAFKFEELRNWQLSMELAERVNELVATFPPKELYNLSSQSRRAADSVSLNIAEGSTNQSDPEQVRFLRMASRSVCEIVTCLMKAKRRKYIDEILYHELYCDYEKLAKMIQTHIQSLIS
jgi:four helix bundle protein